MKNRRGEEEKGEQKLHAKKTELLAKKHSCCVDSPLKGGKGDASLKGGEQSPRLQTGSKHEKRERSPRNRFKGEGPGLRKGKRREEEGKSLKKKRGNATP